MKMWETLRAQMFVIQGRTVKKKWPWRWRGTARLWVTAHQPPSCRWERPRRAAPCPRGQRLPSSRALLWLLAGFHCWQLAFSDDSSHHPNPGDKGCRFPPLKVILPLAEQQRMLEPERRCPPHSPDPPPHKGSASWHQHTHLWAGSQVTKREPSEMEGIYVSSSFREFFNTLV